MSGMAVSANHSQTDGPVVGTEDGASELGDAGMAVGRPWDTSDPFFSAQTRELLKTVFKCYIQQVISWIGVLGNLTCCVVFWKQGLSDRINLLLFWLAVIDFINLASMLPFTLTCYSSDVILINNINVIVHTKINRIYVTCGYISGTLIVVMSVERCLHVVIPFKARRLLTYRSMVTAIFLAYLIPFIVYLPHLLGNTVEWRLDPSTNRSVAYMTPTTWFPLARYQTLLIKYLNLIGQPLCFVTVAVCCTVTIVHLRRTLVKRMEMTGKGGEEGGSADSRLTIMLLFLCFCFALFCLCQICGALIHTLVPGFFYYEKYHNSFEVFFEVFKLTASCVNSTINFCAYLLLSSRFRATLKELCRPCFPRQ